MSPIICTIISFYYITIISPLYLLIHYNLRLFQYFAPKFPGACRVSADANSRPLCPAMTDRSPAALANLLEDQASLFYEAGQDVQLNQDYYTHYFLYYTYYFKCLSRI